MKSKLVQIVYVPYCIFLLYVYVQSFRLSPDLPWFEIGGAMVVVLSFCSLVAFVLRPILKFVLLAVCCVGFVVISLIEVSYVYISRSEQGLELWAIPWDLAILILAFLIIPTAMLIVSIAQMRHHARS